ncbi:type I restriction-modification system subunit M [Treponema brennaborense]|uniref:site-specific DNA-methyltransferase (adenine-specific) n=1 Tax=Treponema brennaborense (strain DSM 12168 / CIP 105900 / DD5/3) TaxID=906968 RepID=F4LNK3_TREBD|nr:type I restriction-modification system subunit M [Treponema brennaborense]AEE15857.1 type I restriction-modification system, M subunit [Treponema brennaborense DSM 12168]
MNKQQLATKIWESANEMRSKIEANEYKDYILGFIFYKYLSETELRFAKKNGCTDADIKKFSENDAETATYIKSNIGYFIAYENLFSTWITKGKDFDVSNVRDALSAFSRLINPAHKKVFDGIFNTLQSGLSKLGETAASQTSAISKLLALINDIPMDGKQDYDVLGFVYEYLISMFAANAGKKAGEFYTPHEVSLLMSEVIAFHLKNRKEIKIYDPTSGSGSLLINIGRSVAKHIDNKNNIKYYAQELKQNTYNLTRMNLIMRNILPDNIVTRNADTLESDWPYFDENDPVHTYDPLYVDAVVSNPPYSQKWDSTNKENDPRYSNYGLAPKSKADYAFLLHDLYHVKPDGIMTIVLPHGVLFRGGEEGEIRKKLIEKDQIQAIIGLPANIFFGTGIPTVIIVLRQKRTDSDVLIVDASKGYIKEGKNNKLRSSDIKRITDTVNGRLSIPGYSSLVKKEVIRQNEYNLNIPRYVDSSDTSESYDLYSSLFGGIPNNEIEKLNNFWEKFSALKKALFTPVNDSYSALAVKDIKECITNHADIKKFEKLFDFHFNTITDYLKKELLDDIQSINTNKEESILSDDLFARFTDMELLDKYQAFQILDDGWNKITDDIEIIQTEGDAAITQVDPHMVEKKKKGLIEEVQEGWVGHILPFELVQKTLLQTELNSIEQKKEQLSQTEEELNQIIESFTEEEKEGSILNETNDAFVTKELASAIKEIKDDCKKEKQPLPVYTGNDDTFEAKLLKADEIIKSQKPLKDAIKNEENALHIKTKETIEGLSKEEQKKLLELKWITPLITALYNMPSVLIHDFSEQIENLATKYSDTLLSLENEITESEKNLSNLLSDLNGNEYDMKAILELQTLLSGK